MGRAEAADVHDGGCDCFLRRETVQERRRSCFAPRGVRRKQTARHHSWRRCEQVEEAAVKKCRQGCERVANDLEQTHRRGG